MTSRWVVARMLLSCMVVLTSFGTVFAQEPQIAPHVGGRLVYGLTLSPSGIDPHVNASSELGIPLASVYDPLVWALPDGSFSPGLAQSWELSPDGKVYTLHLREDVVFHDGERFNAAAVKANLDRIVDPGTRSQKARLMLGPYERTEVVDDFTVRLVLSQPFAPLLDSLSQVYIAMASPSALRQWGQDYQMHQVGTGPYRFKEYVPNDHLTLTVNPDYNWPPAALSHSGRAYLDEIEFRFFSEPATRALALEGDEAQVMGEMPPQDALRIKEDPRFQLLPVPIPGVSLVFFLNTTRPPCDELPVRQALQYAADRPSIVQALFKGFSPPAYGPLSANTLDFNPTLADLYPFDPPKAAELLASAGWTDQDGDGIREKDGKPLRLDAYLMTWGFIPEIGALLQAQFRAVGIDLQTQTLAYPAALEAAREGRHHVIPFNLSGSDPDILRPFFASENVASGFNWSKVADPELDQLLGDAARTTDSARRRQLYEQAQARIMESALVLPIRDYVNINAAASRVKGLRFDVRGWFPVLYEVYLES